MLHFRPNFRAFSYLGYKTRAIVKRVSNGGSSQEESAFSAAVPPENQSRYDKKEPDRVGSEVFVFRRPSRTTPRARERELCKSLLFPHYYGNGRGGIRTHGGLPHARFRVECLKPDSATLPFLQD